MFQSETGNPNDVVVQYAATSYSENWVWAYTGADYVTVKDISIKSTSIGIYSRVVDNL